MATTYISYLRVSTDRQGAAGLGIEAQREAVQRYVACVGGNLLAEHVEVETGRSATRPILLQSIAQCRRDRAVLLIARLDRLARSVSFIASLIDSGVEFVAVDNPAANKPMLQMLAVFGEYERDQIAARTKAALSAAKARGVVLGANGKVLAASHKAAAETFAETLRGPVQEAFENGAKTLKDVAWHLNEAGLTTSQGSRWSPQSTHRIVHRLGLRTAAMTA
ncbi:recombinase family protein [uncultured Sphingomonas sp.]|uniref:recombinase family protein n=1 Tax=uncultured Sphingomonas sp. TaxID=158754 RepID=UPI0030D8855C